MFKPVKAKSVKEYFEALGEERRELMEFLHKFIQKNRVVFKIHFNKCLKR